MIRLFDWIPVPALDLIRNSESFKLQMPWMPDQVRDDGKRLKTVIDSIFILNPHARGGHPEA